MLPSRIGQVIEALVTMYQAAVLPLDTTDSGIPVLDGPESVDMGSLPEYVVVGDELDADTGAESTFSQTWAGLGAQSKTENGSVLCTIAVRTGGSYETSIREMRQRALEILAACETAHRANVNLGGLVLFSAIESGTYRPVNDTEGTGAEVTFTVTYEARI